MRFKRFAPLLAALVAVHAGAATRNFYYTVQDGSAQDVGFLTLTDTNGFGTATLAIDGSPQTSIAVTDDTPGALFDLEYSGGTLTYFQVNYYICEPGFGCDFFETWEVKGDATRGEVTINDTLSGPVASYTLATPEPSGLALLLAGLGLAGAALRRRTS